MPAQTPVYQDKIVDRKNTITIDRNGNPAARVIVSGEGAHYTANIEMAAGGAGNKSHAQLLNPASSGKVAYITRLEYIFNTSTATAGLITLERYDTDLSGTGVTPLNKIPSGAASVMTSQGRNTGNISVTAANVIAAKRWRGNIEPSVIFEFVHPIVLEETDGILLNPGDGNLAATVNMEWYEK